MRNKKIEIINFILVSVAMFILSYFLICSKKRSNSNSTNMKEIILSCDAESYVYLVPKEVADNLYEYCAEFGNVWLFRSPDAERFRDGDGVCFDEKDFIDYLNKYIFPNQKSTLVKNLGWTNLGKRLPFKYRKHPYFNF